MQFTTLALALAAATATVQVYNLSKCDPIAAAGTFELQEIGDCVNFGQGYGAASWTPSEDAGPVLGTSFFFPLHLSVSFQSYSLLSSLSGIK